MSDKDLGEQHPVAVHTLTLAIARPRAARQLMGISQSTLRRLVKAGKLRQVQLGPRAVGYRISDISDFLAGAVAA